MPIKDPEKIDLSKIIRPRATGPWSAVRSKYVSSKLTPAQAAVISALGNRDLTKPLHMYSGFLLPPPIDTRRHYTYLSVAEKGGGKSCTLASIAEAYMAGPMKAIVLDAIDGGSFENLHWCIKPKVCDACNQRVSPIARRCPNSTPSGVCGEPLDPGPESKYPIILVLPDGFRLHVPDWADIVKVGVSDAKLEDMLQLAKDEGRVLVFGWSFYKSQDTVIGLQKLATWCQDMGKATHNVDVDVVFLIREAGSYLFSRDRIWPRTDPELRTSAIQLIREARHQTRTIALLDSQRWIDVLASIRTRADRIFLGGQASSQLGEDLKWLQYRLWDYHKKHSTTYWMSVWPDIGYLQPWQKYIIFRAQEFFFLAHMDWPSFHHRLEGEYVTDFGFRFRFEDAPDADAGQREADERAAAETRERERAEDRVDGHVEGLLAMAARLVRPRSERQGSARAPTTVEQEILDELLRSSASIRAIERVTGFDRSMLAERRREIRERLLEEQRLTSARGDRSRDRAPTDPDPDNDGAPHEPTAEDDDNREAE